MDHFSLAQCPSCVESASSCCCRSKDMFTFRFKKQTSTLYSNQGLQSIDGCCWWINECIMRRAASLDEAIMIDISINNPLSINMMHFHLIESKCKITLDSNPFTLTYCMQINEFSTSTFNLNFAPLGPMQISNLVSTCH